LKSVVVIPTYNEAGNIGPLIDAIQGAMPGLDIVVVDDNSSDGTAAIAERRVGVHVIRRPGKQGLGTAYVAGYKYAIGAGYDRIGGMDADFSHDPKVLPTLFGLLDSFDVGLGARYVPGGGTRNWGLHRRLLSGAANRFAKWMLHMPVHDATGGYRCYRRDVLEAIDLDSLRSQGYSFLVELLYRCVRKGYRVGETPIIFEERRAGASKLDRREIFQGVVNLFRLRFGGNAG